MPAGCDAASDAPQFVQKRVSSALGAAQEGHDFMAARQSSAARAARLVEEIRSCYG